MEDLLFPYVRICKKCGKEIILASNSWVYKKGTTYYCSWKCYRKQNDNPKQDIIRPKVGDTIKVLYMYDVPEYTNKIGVVKSIDYLGQLHGTWGVWQIIPGKDRYEIIETGVGNV